VPAILGYSPWATPVDVWLDKRDGDDSLQSYAMKRGNALQRIVADEWARTSGTSLVRPPLLVGHPELPWLLASLDYCALTDDGPVVVEVKATTAWREWENGWCPDHHAVQVLTQLAVTRLPAACLVADVNGRLEVRRIERDLIWEDQALPLLGEWWERHVIGGEPPDPDPDRDFPSLSRLWLPEPGTRVDADEAVMGAVHAHHALAVRLKSLESINKGLRTQVRMHMKAATELHYDGARVAQITKAGALRFDPPQLTEQVSA
jgi:putative phage-type endonuclease